MNDDILKIAENLTSIINAEMPANKNEASSFLQKLNERLPESPRVVRTIFEDVYKKKFGEKYGS